MEYDYNPYLSMFAKACVQWIFLLHMFASACLHRFVCSEFSKGERREQEDTPTEIGTGIATGNQLARYS